MKGKGDAHVLILRPLVSLSLIIAPPILITTILVSSIKQDYFSALLIIRKAIVRRSICNSFGKRAHSIKYACMIRKSVGILNMLTIGISMVSGCQVKKVAKFSTR